MPELVVGPLLRYVDATSASIWVETSEPCEVTVEAGRARGSARTFTVHGHHYAIVDVDGGGAYEVRLDGETVWPLPDHPPSRIRLLGSDGPRKVMFGSCRTSVPHDTLHTISHGVDVLRAYGCHLMESAGTLAADGWPDLLLLLGDQVYADEPSAEMLEFIAGRRDTEPKKEIADFEEYAELYRVAWTDPEIRWMLSTVPTAMIFDDHDLRDDWNTSADWREKMSTVEWWPRRVISGLGAYWVYQHLGNLSPAEREADGLLGKLCAAEGDGAEILDAFAAHADAVPAGSRWSYARDLGSTRLIMLDTRCARQLTPGDRRMIDPVEWEWLTGQLEREGAERFVIGSSVPFLLPAGIHHIQNWNEALAQGAWGRRVARLSEMLRQAIDLEHWSAFRRSFEDLARLLVETGKPVVILSGDVHYSYVAKARRHPIHQLVCSPIRNPLSRTLRLANIVAQFGVATLIGGALSRLAKIPRPPIRWRITEGPWFSNAIATLDLEGPLSARWDTATSTGVTEVATVDLRA
ncbi:alkaline phosphatase D family protein [Planomonospora sp. ID82291]|uniref:alkaline phosphatase D family protein n=1 Tax=Planomonospora sp. ID82291 TaxID=2738136 RepID=UPI0018C441EE|nr:alkaline phosphatase D family protein [Planomonospora sp. ID82291]MBG0816021.1 alkaline phosphatase family protein [Planomonospora sp. ID82291]